MALTEIDRNLLKRCLAQDPAAWKDFVDRFLGLFVHVIQHTAHARSVTVSQDDIDDLCAELFLTILTDDFAVLRHFRGESSLATYLTVVARRVVVREMVRRKMAEAFGHVPGHLAGEKVAPSSLEHSRIENREHVGQMLAGLPEKEAEIVRQYHLEGRTYPEISRNLGIAENSIGPTLHRALSKLRFRLA